jgi:hypothetical protein
MSRPVVGSAAERWLPPASALSALVATGALTPRAARRFARLDRVAAVSGAPAAFELLEPPAVSRSTVRVHAPEPALLSDAARLAHAVWLARTLAPHARVQLRTGADPPAETLAAAGFAPFTLWIRKRPGPAQVVPGTVVRRAHGAGDWAFVARCHRDALVSGMPSTAFTAAQLDRYVHDALRIGRRGGPEALICEHGGVRSGQVTWRMATDRWRGAVVDVVDVFVLPEHLRGPTGAALTAALEREVSERRPGLDLLGNIVAEEGRERQVLQRLERHGWRLDHELWQLA